MQVRLRKALLDERREWQQRLRALLFHQGLAAGVRLSSAAERAQLAGRLPAGGQLLSVGGRAIAHLDGELELLDGQLRSFAGRQPGCRALTAQLYGVGALTATALLAELGDTRRFARSDDAVRYAGLDITVWQSDQRRAPGHLSRQGPQLLRWALYEAAQCAARPRSPDHAYYLQARARLGHQRACLAVARKLLRRAHHLLRELGDASLAPASDSAAQAA